MQYTSSFKGSVQKKSVIQSNWREG